MRSQLQSIGAAGRVRRLAGLMMGLALLVSGRGVLAAAHSEFVRTFPLRTLITFAFRDQQRATGDPLQGNPIWIADIESEIRHDLVAAGRSEAAAPDFYVAFYVEVGNPYNLNIDYATSIADNQIRGRSPTGATVPYRTSTVIVDVIDARSNQLVWRGYDSDTFSARDPDGTLGQAAGAVMARFDRDAIGKE